MKARPCPKSIFGLNVLPSVSPRDEADDCKYVLETMQHWSWNNYVMLLGLKSYDARERRDSKGILRGYTLRNGNVIIKASELRGRVFMVKILGVNFTHKN